DHPLLRHQRQRRQLDERGADGGRDPPAVIPAGAAPARDAAPPASARSAKPGGAGRPRADRILQVSTPVSPRRLASPYPSPLVVTGPRTRFRPAPLGRTGVQGDRSRAISSLHFAPPASRPEVISNRM